MHSFSAICPTCGKARIVQLETVIDAAPFFCPCGSRMEIRAKDETPKPVNTPEATVREVTVPEIERLTDKGLPIYISRGRQEAFEKLMRSAFPTGIPGMEFI